MKPRGRRDGGERSRGLTVAVAVAIGIVLLAAALSGAAAPHPAGSAWGPAGPAADGRAGLQEASAVDGEPGRRAPSQEMPPPPPDPRRADAPERRPGADTLTAAQVDALTAEVADQLRCPVCRNQSVLESSAELSREMQDVIHERLAAGHSPEEVKAYFVERYGEWILLKPEPKGINLAVYLLPALVLLGGAWLVRGRLRSWVQASPDAPEAAGTAGTAASPDASEPPEGADRGGDPAATAAAEGGPAGPEGPAAGGREPAAGGDEGAAPEPLGTEEEERWLERALREG